VVTIRFFAAAKAITKVSQIELPANSLDELLRLANVRFGGLTTALPKCSYLVNGLATKDLATELKSGDIVDVLPPFAGG